MLREYSMVCIVCNNTVLSSDAKFMLALDIPYLNLYLHKSCYKKIQNHINEFLSENLQNFMDKYVKIHYKQ